MRLLTSLLFLISFSSSVAANCSGPNLFEQRPEAERTALIKKAQKTPFAEGLLWQIEKNEVTSYIIGTFHVHLPEHAAMVDRVRGLSPRPEQLFLELTAEDQLAFQQHLVKHPELYLIQEGGSLIDRLGPKLWAGVVEQLKSRGLPPFMAAKYQPWFLGMTLMMPPCAMEIVKSGAKGLDVQIEKMAEDRDLPIHSLDTVESLLDILAGTPLEQQLDDLRWSLTLQGDLAAPEMIPAVIDMYLTEQVQLIWEVNNADFIEQSADYDDTARVVEMLQEVEDQLLIRRNTTWVQTLVPALEQTPSLVAVGALHLPGEAGVLSQLKNAGFAITRLPL
ncbi:TraB/GumN family protein [Shimia sp. NS0008-38b]|uniref:TraB/GumN family protein n=1 Tax=Shimia sp. NS0008-38b TaxID=3127653 RepID=UPI003108FEF9